MKTLIAKTTDETTSATFHVTVVPRTLYRSGTYGAAEYARVQYHDGAAWQDAEIAGTAQQLDSSTSLVTLYGPLENCRISKTATVADAGALISGTPD